MLSYKDTKAGLAVYLDNRHIGTIKTQGRYWHYVPKQGGLRNAGPLYDSVALVKREL